MCHAREPLARRRAAAGNWPNTRGCSQIDPGHVDRMCIRMTTPGPYSADDGRGVAGFSCVALGGVGILT